MKILVILFSAALVGCGGNANVHGNGDASGGSGVDVDVIVTKQEFAKICRTQWGDCPMSVPMATGLSCYCYWQNGSQSPGITQ